MRYIIPKGTTIEPLNQSAVSLIMNHVNSFCRKSLIGKCPFDLTESVLPEDFFIPLGLKKDLSGRSKPDTGAAQELLLHFRVNATLWIVALSLTASEMRLFGALKTTCK